MNQQWKQKRHYRGKYFTNVFFVNKTCILETDAADFEINYEYFCKQCLEKN